LKFYDSFRLARFVIENISYGILGLLGGEGNSGNKTCRFSTINTKAHPLVMPLQVKSLGIILISCHFLGL
jgi:hypothetical protein